MYKRRNNNRNRSGGGADHIERKAIGATYTENEILAMAEAGIKKCRGCKEYRILYKAGYCRECRDKWMAERGIGRGGILSSGL